jgi:hypothetical protein
MATPSLYVVGIYVNWIGMVETQLFAKTVRASPLGGYLQIGRKPLSARVVLGGVHQVQTSHSACLKSILHARARARWGCVNAVSL